MIVYLDSSALVKRVILETESGALAVQLDRWAGDGDTLVTSELAWVEVSHAVTKAAGATANAENAFVGVHRVPLGAPVLNVAVRMAGPGLRSLDAIHVASAIVVGAHLVVTYDKRMAEAAKAHGFEVGAPSPPPPKPGGRRRSSP